ncbi:restriction endonuclease subunit S [Halomonas sp. PBN3]|uniref:restriction endonuclease subunit S n=1 Tax=Halomonas sp. PBN3 TaxID=1397528 RepID=UPI0004ADCDE6|nr:restriction endonuclease subunit S [Halomonas sp. PBN3]
MSRFSPYPEYKDSGVEWLGEVPAHWEVKPLKRAIAAVESGTSVNAADVPAAQGELGVLKTSCVYKGWFDWRENKTVNQEDLGRVSCPLRKNTLIVSRMNTPELVGSAGLVLEAPVGIFLPDRLWQVSLEESCSPKYYYFFTRTPAYRDQVKVACAGTSSSMQNLGQDEFGGIWHPSPPKQEQHTIAAFLDHETARIDALVAEQQRLIDLLKEKRQAVISHAVTKGLDPDVTMKDSGVEWLGKVPAHWVVGPLRWYATIQGGVAKGKGYSDDTPTVDLPYLRVANVQDGHVDLSSVNTVTVALSEVERYRLHPGDVLMNEGGDNDKLGRGTVWEGEIADCLHQNHVFAIRPNDHLLPHWLSMFTGSKAARSYFYLYSKQSTNLASVSSSNVMSCPIPLPPREEQRQVLDFLGRETARIENLILEGEKAISFLQERRSALISAAVTGKIDVRGWQADQQSEQPEILMAAETRATYG